MYRSHTLTLTDTYPASQHILPVAEPLYCLGAVLSQEQDGSIADCGPASGVDDFRIDDEISLDNDGSGSGKTVVELGSADNGIQLAGSGDDEDFEESGSASGVDENEEDIDLGFSGPDITIGSSESTTTTSVITSYLPTELKTTEPMIPTTVAFSGPDITIGSSESTTTTPVITSYLPTELKTTEPMIPTTAVTVTKIPVLISHDDRGSGHPPLTSTNTEAPSSTTIVNDGGDLIVPSDGSDDGSGSGSGSGVDIIDSEANEESSSVGIIVEEPMSSSESSVTTSSIQPEEEDEEGSIDQTDFSIDRTLSNLTSESGSGIIDEVAPPTLSGLPPSHTLSPDEVITEEFLPVTGRKSQNTSSTSSSTTPQTNVDTRTLPPPVVELTLGHVVEDDSTVHTTPEDTSFTTSSGHMNQTGHIHGRRRKPVQTDTTDATDGEVSVGAISEEDENKQEKGVSYFAVIAAALIAAIVFFILGYITSKLKNREGALTLPWKKDKMNLEASVEAGNGSAAQVYRDTNPEKYTPVHHEVVSKDLAEVHPKPKDLNLSDTNVASHSIPMTELSPVNTEDQPVSGETETKIEELKYIDETDEELDPVVTTPLLEQEEVVEADRGDLASQVLNTVDKNLNAISENDRLLPPSADAIALNGVETSGESSTR